MNRVRASVLFVGLSGSVVLAACGGAAESAPAKAPAGAAEPSAVEREPTSVAEAQEQIDRLRAEGIPTDVKKTEAAADKDTARPEPGASGGSTSSTTAKPATSPAAREEKRAAPPDPCAHSCRAITSMRRAVTALCRMTGDEDARCSEAKKTLSESESRVAQCHCGS